MLDCKHRRRRVMTAFLSVVLAALSVLVPSAASAEPDIIAMLRRVDEQLSFHGTDFSTVVTLLSQDPDKGLEKIVFRQFRRDHEDKFLLLIQEPSHQRGQGYLRDGDNLWFYDPESRKFSHTSLKETIEGTDARSSDFAHSTFVDDYRVEAYESGVLGQYAVYIVDLAAVHSEVPDPFLKMWITQDTNLVLKIESYSLNRRLVRTGLFPSYQRVGDGIIPKQQIYIDELVPGKKTQVTVNEVSLAPLDPNVFTKAYVERVSR